MKAKEYEESKLGKLTAREKRTLDYFYKNPTEGKLYLRDNELFYIKVDGNSYAILNEYNSWQHIRRDSIEQFIPLYNN